MVDADLYLIVAIGSPLFTFAFFWLLEVWKSAAAKKAYDMKALNSIFFELGRNLKSAQLSWSMVEEAGLFASGDKPRIHLVFEHFFEKKFVSELPLEEDDLLKVLNAYGTLCFAVHLQSTYESVSLPGGVKAGNAGVENDKAIANLLKVSVDPQLRAACVVLAKKIELLKKVGRWEYFVAEFSPKKSNCPQRPSL